MTCVGACDFSFEMCLGGCEITDNSCKRDCAEWLDECKVGRFRWNFLDLKQNLCDPQATCPPPACDVNQLDEPGIGF